MKAITIHNPWSWAILDAQKDIENRTWPFKPGQEIAIHAGKQYDGDAEQFMRRLGIEAPGDLPRGVILGIVTVTDVHHAVRCRVQALPRDRHCSPWAMGNQYHWVLANPRPLPEPVACRGAQGIWTVPEDKAAQVLNQLGTFSHAEETP